MRMRASCGRVPPRPAPALFPAPLQLAILMGCAVLPHLRMLVEIVGASLEDDQQKAS